MRSTEDRPTWILVVVPGATMPIQRAYGASTKIALQAARDKVRLMRRAPHDSLIIDGPLQLWNEDRTKQIGIIEARTVWNGEVDDMTGDPDAFVTCDRCSRSFLRRHRFCICRG